MLGEEQERGATFERFRHSQQWLALVERRLHMCVLVGVMMGDEAQSAVRISVAKAGVAMPRVSLDGVVVQRR